MKTHLLPTFEGFINERQWDIDIDNKILTYSKEKKILIELIITDNTGPYTWWYTISGKDLKKYIDGIKKMAKDYWESYGFPSPIDFDIKHEVTDDSKKVPDIAAVVYVLQDWTTGEIKVSFTQNK